jgi:hypothetical protein
VIGDMQALYTKFVQSTWSSCGKMSPWVSQYQPITTILYPIDVTNKGNIQERWALYLQAIRHFESLVKFLAR